MYFSDEKSITWMRNDKYVIIYFYFVFFFHSHLYDIDTQDTTLGRTIITTNSQLVTLMDVIPGRLELTSTHVSFYDEKNDSLFGSGYDFRFALTELQEMHVRRYNLRKSALEFFLVDRSSYLVNFIEKQVL